MAFFKFRKGGEEHAAPSAPPAPSESVEAMRKRALYRLIGSAVLVLAGVIGFPMLFDSQPRPISVDIPVEIPDRNKTRPLSMPTAPVVATPAAPEPAPIEAKEAVPAPKLEEKEAVALVKQAQIAPKEIAIPEAKVADKSGDGAKALALLEGKVADKPAASGEGRFVVQVGAFSDAARAKEARTKVERAGLKTYTQVVETKDGPRTRVRVGPFSDRAEAERTAQKIKALDLAAAILTL
jgi:DedD protein